MSYMLKPRKAWGLVVSVTPPLVFPKMCFMRFLILSQVTSFPENFIEIPQVVQKL